MISYYYRIIFLIVDVLIVVLISIAFLTLLERKILGYIQLRKGPNKVGIVGLLQPFSDGLKLFTKEFFIILKSNYLYYLISPIIIIFLILIYWIFIPYYVNFLNRNIQILIIICLIRVAVFPLIVSGWSSNSFYATLGRFRRVAQTISYEVSISFVFFSVIVLSERFNLYDYIRYQFYSWNIITLFPAGIILFISLLAEIHRTPFDFSEGESELVSGFNVEYIRGPFAVFFIAEYGIILFIIYLFRLLFLGGNIYSIVFYFNFIIIVILVIWIRGTLPRARYDEIIYIIWKRFLGRILLYIVFIVRIYIIIRLLL